MEIKTSPTALKIAPSAQVLECLSAGKPIHTMWITDPLDLDPLVVSRWLCGEDMRGIYQPIIIYHSFLDELDFAGRTFYEMIELVDCHIKKSCFRGTYFYASLLIEDCIFKGDFEGQRIQSDGPLVVHNTVFIGYADFRGINLRGDQISLLDVSFPGGTNLLYELARGPAKRLGRDITLSGCRFRTVDIPLDLDTSNLGIAPPIECELSGAES